MKSLLLAILLMSTPLTWASGDSCQMCKEVKKIELECQIGRFTNQCIIIGCPMRKLIIVKSQAGTIRKVVLSTPCTGEVLLYEQKGLET